MTEPAARAEFWRGIRKRLRLPLVAAPMSWVSCPPLVIAACRSGIVGSFPTANARSVSELDAWLLCMKSALEGQAAPGPIVPNLILRHSRAREDLACLVAHRVEMVIASVGSPAEVVRPLHDVGSLVFSDVDTLRHAEKALAAGVDGLVLLTAGAGGQTGWVNPFAFVRAVRTLFDGPIIVAGGISDGQSLYAAEVLGADLAYMGTKFIATTESMASVEYKQMLVDSGFDDVMTTRAFTGLDTNMLRPSIVRSGLDPDALNELISVEAAAKTFGSAGSPELKRWTDVWSAGHSVAGVEDILDVSVLVELTLAEYQRAKARPIVALQNK
jgi:nitronate monooxygenase